MTKKNLAQGLIPVVALLCLSPWVSSAMALVLGLLIAFFFENPYFEKTKSSTHTLLSLAVIGLGFGMDLGVIGKVGLQGLSYTVVGISLTFLLGISLGRILGISKDTGLLVTMGTAICGGSAIAALAPTIRAKNEDVSVALGTVFMLNAVALLIFGPIGHAFHLSEDQFGLWSALAIHDTSSVVGATLQYGSRAMEVGTTVKLARALWIVPVTMIVGFFWNRHQAQEAGTPKARKPWFIAGFLIAAAIVTLIPEARPAGRWIEVGARHLMVLTLFVIGLNLTKSTLRSVGIKPLLQGLALWIIVASTTLAAVALNWIHL